MKDIGIGKRLREVRGHISQKDFAKKVDIPLRTYQRYESGERIPPSDCLYRIAETVDIPADWLLKGDAATLQKKLVQERQTLSKLEENLEELNSKLLLLFKESETPVPDDLNGFINTYYFLKEHGIDLMLLLEEGETCHENKLKTGINCDKEEYEWLNKLLTILRTKKKKTVIAIQNNLDAFLETPDDPTKREDNRFTLKSNNTFKKSENIEEPNNDEQPKRAGSPVRSLAEKRLVKFFKQIDDEGRGGVIGLIRTYSSTLEDSKSKSLADDLQFCFKNSGGEVTPKLTNKLTSLFRSLPVDGKMGLVGMLSTYVSAMDDDEVQNSYDDFKVTFLNEVKRVG
ncbi:MAG: helix-turn-helix domain-containing protein [Deltaproteobacteria bacterium]|nr:helix-turn-helix domain-containing protein [Deltaproteobacteria bacterium]